MLRVFLKSSDSKYAVIAALPLSRCLLEDEIEISDALTLYPPGVWEGLPLIGDLPSPGSIAAMATSFSGISPEVIESSAIAIYRDVALHSTAVGTSHKSDLFLLERTVAQCESLMDVARFDMCRLDFPDTLFGRIGTWDGSNGASGAVFFASDGTKTDYVGGRYLVSTITAGIGLDFNGYQPSYQHRKDEIGNVVKQALAIFRSALEANDWTSKYVHCIRLFEVLADPFQLANSNKWEKVRGKLCSHLANDKQTYLTLADHFKSLGNVGNGGSRGLRERVIHHGELLEDVFNSSEELKNLFKEIQAYVRKVLLDLMTFEGESWQQVSEWRENRLSTFGITP